MRNETLTSKEVEDDAAHHKTRCPFAGIDKSEELAGGIYHSSRTKLFIFRTSDNVSLDLTIETRSESLQCVHWIIFLFLRNKRDTWRMAPLRP